MKSKVSQSKEYPDGKEDLTADKILWVGLFNLERWYECCIHKIPYPKGDGCPQCAHERARLKREISIIS